MRPDQPEPCMIGDCRRKGAVYVMRAGYICESHADRIWYFVERRDAETSDRMTEGREGRDSVRAEVRKRDGRRAADRRKPTAVGEIYFVQVDGLIKVGWTTQLGERVRAYGPKATLLANYPGSRADEAALHRQLTPARFRGREWYSDGDIIRMFINEALDKHGPPRFASIEWTEPRNIVAGKKATRGRR